MVIISLGVVFCWEWLHGHYLVRSGRLWPASWSLSR